MSSQHKRKIFLSYARNDREAARKLYEVLKTGGIDVWFDEAELVPGAEWESALKEAIKSADTVLLLAGAGMSLGKWQQIELRTALDRATRDRNFLIVPILLPGSSITDLPLSIQHYQAIDLREVDDIASRFNRIAATLVTDPES